LKILFFGDIFGKPGREAVKKFLPGLRKKYKPEAVFANAENIAHGHGITKKTLEELQEAGVDAFTSGNHAWATKDGIEVLRSGEIPVVRPANYPLGVPGEGVLVHVVGKKKVLLVNLMGRVFMREQLDDPFRALDKIVKKYRSETKIMFVDFHGEATAEKRAFGWYADGRVSVVVGTHTHVPTADSQILPKGTGYITDVGMVGPYHSVIGAEIECVISHQVTQLPLKVEVAESVLQEINAVLVDIDEKTGKTKKITQIRELVAIK